MMGTLPFVSFLSFLFYMNPSHLLRCGFSVIPCYSRTGTDRDKTPHIAWKSYQTKRATPSEIHYWHRQWPDCNWAIVTGAISGIVVLDIDSIRGILAVMQRGVPKTPSVRTGKGLQLYFRHPGYPVGNWTKENRPLPGCDFRGDGGYVMAPGSIHPSGAVYAWIDSIEETELMEMPTWLADLNRPVVAGATLGAVGLEGQEAVRVEGDPRKYALGAMKQELKRLRATQKGGRDNQTFTAAAKLFAYVASGLLDGDEVTDCLRRAAKTTNKWPQHPFTDEQIERAIESGRKAGYLRPRIISTIF